MKRGCKKNQRKMYYALYDKKIPILDDDGNPTFEYVAGYKKPVEFYASLSVGKSDAEESPFGNDVSYDRIIISFDMGLPVDETTLIFVHNAPTYDENGIVNEDSADYKVAAPVLDGLDSLRIAIKFNK